MLLTASSTSTILCLSYTATAANGGNQMMRNFLIFLVLHVASVRPILHIGEYSLVALQHRRIRYIGLRVSADAE